LSIVPSGPWLSFKDNDTRRLPAWDGLPESAHVWTAEESEAINAARAAGRPLLVRGEPGVGKSHLGRAAAEALGFAYVYQATDARTGPHDLLWRFDPIARLAQAQLLGAPGAKGSLEDLAMKRFVAPGALWWGFDWASATTQSKVAGPGPSTRWQDASASRGVVVLIDEIDKADPTVPNAMLDALGHGAFSPEGCDRVHQKGPAPLVLFTTNEDRALPDAFVRRCLVLPLKLPEDPTAWLVTRGKAHFGERIHKDILREAATQTATDRVAVARHHRCAPGLAEYLDLLRALHRLAPGDPAAQRARLDSIHKFFLQKHASDDRR
jgi:MoxR-like ATPase